MSDLAYKHGTVIEWGIQASDSEFPFAVSNWTKKDAEEAAAYNNARWGNKYRVVSRYVTDWTDES